MTPVSENGVNPPEKKASTEAPHEMYAPVIKSPSQKKPSTKVKQPDDIEEDNYVYSAKDKPAVPEKMSCITSSESGDTDNKENQTKEDKDDDFVKSETDTPLMQDAPDSLDAPAVIPSIDDKNDHFPSLMPNDSTPLSTGDNCIYNSKDKPSEPPETSCRESAASIDTENKDNPLKEEVDDETYEDFVNGDNCTPLVQDTQENLYDATLMPSVSEKNDYDAPLMPSDGDSTPASSGDSNVLHVQVPDYAPSYAKTSGDDIISRPSVRNKQPNDNDAATRTSLDYDYADIPGEQESSTHKVSVKNKGIENDSYDTASDNYSDVEIQDDNTKDDSESGKGLVSVNKTLDQTGPDNNHSEKGKQQSEKTGDTSVTSEKTLMVENEIYST